MYYEHVKWVMDNGSTWLYQCLPCIGPKTHAQFIMVQRKKAKNCKGTYYSKTRDMILAHDLFSHHGSDKFYECNGYT